MAFLFGMAWERMYHHMAVWRVGVDVVKLEWWGKGEGGLGTDWAV